MSLLLVANLKAALQLWQRLKLPQKTMGLNGVALEGRISYRPGAWAMICNERIARLAISAIT
jgi:hypothetical protein